MKIKSNITVVIADDHPIMLKGLGDELKSEGYDVIGLAGNGAVALDLLVSKKPMIAILDIEMPLLSGFEVIEKSIHKTPDTRFIFMTYHKEQGFVVQAKKYGAMGYLLKEDGLEEIEACVNQVLDNKFYYSKSLNDNIEDMVKQELKKLKLLTPSERTILRMISNKNSSKEISAHLVISKRTVDKHRTNIIKKLGISPDSNALPEWISQHTELIKTL
jgi:DNA-binding NarL/FixJ family response regulator